MTLSGLLAYLRGQSKTPATKLTAIYLAGWLLLLAGYFAGIVGPMAHRAGFVAWAVAALVSVHIWVAIRATAEGRTADFIRGEATTAWLEKIDASILGLGFLGKLYAIAVALGAIGSTGDAASALAGIATITQSISAALFSTMAGLAVSLWTHCATLVVSNHFAAAREDLTGPLTGPIITLEEVKRGPEPVDAFFEEVLRGP
jgi:hypothetical protein